MQPRATICDHCRQRSAGGTSVQSDNELHCWLSTGQSVQILKMSLKLINGFVHIKRWAILLIENIKLVMG
jgi:hypothetical protein